MAHRALIVPAFQARNDERAVVEALTEKLGSFFAKDKGTWRGWGLDPVKGVMLHRAEGVPRPDNGAYTVTTPDAVAHGVNCANGDFVRLVDFTARNIVVAYYARKDDGTLAEELTTITCQTLRETAALLERLADEEDEKAAARRQEQVAASMLASEALLEAEDDDSPPL